MIAWALVCLLTCSSTSAKLHAPVALLSDGSPTLNYRAYGQVPRQSFESSSSRRAEAKEHLQYERRSLTDFATRGSRTGFIRKVSSIFCAQMICTIGITGMIMSNSNIQDYLFRNFKAFMITAYLISTGVIVALVSNPELRYKRPMNFLLLGLHTIMQSILVGIFSSAINPRLVCLGTVHTLATFLAITLYSFQPNEKFDLTPFGNVLLTGSSSLLVGIVLNFFLKMPLVDNIISGALAVLFASYLAFDTQKIVGGKHHKYSYSQKEYIMAALNLYQDVINFFIQIMNILMKLEKKNNDIN